MEDRSRLTSARATVQRVAPVLRSVQELASSIQELAEHYDNERVAVQAQRIISECCDLRYALLSAIMPENTRRGTGMEPAHHSRVKRQRGATDIEAQTFCWKCGTNQPAYIDGRVQGYADGCPACLPDRCSSWKGSERCADLEGHEGPHRYGSRFSS